jgi:hypothetical protein
MLNNFSTAHPKINQNLPLIFFSLASILTPAILYLMKTITLCTDMYDFPASMLTTTLTSSYDETFCTFQQITQPEPDEDGDELYTVQATCLDESLNDDDVDYFKELLMHYVDGAMNSYMYMREVQRLMEEEMDDDDCDECDEECENCEFNPDRVPTDPSKLN